MSDYVMRDASMLKELVTRQARAEGLREAARITDESNKEGGPWDLWDHNLCQALECLADDFRARADAIERGEA